MPNVGWGVFGGENRKKSPFLLSQGESVLARNMDLSSGKAKPFRAPSFHKQALAGTQDIAFFAGALRELPFVAETAAVGLPRGGRREQLLITGAGQAPQQMQTDGTRARLGAPYRDAPPALTAVKVDPNPTQNKRDYRFACSVLMADGTESPLWGVLENISLGEGGSFPGLQFDVPVDDDGNLSTAESTDDGALITEFNRGGSGAATPARADYETPYGVRLYQQVSARAYTKVEDIVWGSGAVTGTPSGRVRRFTFGPVRYGDAPAAATQAEFVGIETRPRLDLRGIVAHPKGFMCGFSGNFLCFSAAEQYGVWPRSYEVEIPEGDIIAIAEFASDLYVFVDNNPPLRVRLDSPAAPDIRRSESTFILREANARAVVNMGQLGLWYPAKQGIVALPNGRLITDAILDENDFSAPLFAFNDADEYFGARAADNLYLTRRGVEPGFIQAGRIDHHGYGIAQGVAKDGGTVYLLHAGGEITIWASGEPMVMTWKSGKVKLYDENNPPVLVWIYAGQADAHTRIFSDWLAPFIEIVGDGAEVADFYPRLFDYEMDAAPVSPIADDFAAVVKEESDRQGSIQIKVHSGLPDYDYEGVGVITADGPQVRGGAIEIRLPEHADPNETMREDVCDCIVNVPMVGEVSFLQLEFSSERMVEFVGFFGCFEDFVLAKQRVPVFPAPGFVG